MFLILWRGLKKQIKISQKWVHLFAQGQNKTHGIFPDCVDLYKLNINYCDIYLSNILIAQF